MHHVHLCMCVYEVFSANLTLFVSVCYVCVRVLCVCVCIVQMVCGQRWLGNFIHAYIPAHIHIVNEVGRNVFAFV